MLKVIDGVEFMTGTSKGSQYLVCFWADQVRIGIQFNVKVEGCNQIHVDMYARAQMFDEDGNDIVPDFGQMYRAFKNVPGFQFRSEHHMAAPIASASYSKHDKTSI